MRQRRMKAGAHIARSRRRTAPIRVLPVHKALNPGARTSPLQRQAVMGSGRLRRHRAVNFLVAKRARPLSAAAEATGTGLRRLLRCTITGRLTVDRSGVTPVRNLICISPSCGLRLTADILAGRVRATAAAATVLRVTVVRTAATAVVDTPLAAEVDTRAEAEDTRAAAVEDTPVEAVIIKARSVRSHVSIDVNG